MLGLYSFAGVNTLRMVFAKVRTSYGLIINSRIPILLASCGLIRSLNQDFHFGPGTVTVYTRAAPNTTSFRAEPCTSPPAAGPKARPSAHRR